MEKKIKKLLSNSMATGIAIVVLIVCLCIIISNNSLEKRSLLANIEVLQLEVVSLEKDRKTLVDHITEMEDERQIYLATLQDMKAYNAKLEAKIKNLETDITTAEFMINDLEQSLADLNSKIEAQPLD
tara:strand:+ start:2467 stop:2850 length:384 start_codon:yes stop_codon:yes gene_type:complete